MLVFLSILFCFTSISESAENKKEFHKIKSDESYVYYEGSVIVQGAYHVQVIEDNVGSEYGLVCFSVHGPTERYIPRENDSRNAWFCFKNTAKARSAMSIPTTVPPSTCIIYGEATVQISKYIVNRCESECHDEATLDKVIKYEKPTFRKECITVP